MNREKMKVNKLKEHIRNLPCLTCLTRFFCFRFNDDWGINIEDPCEVYIKWHKKYKRSYTKLSAKSLPYIKVISELEKIRQEERKKNVKR